MRGLRVGRPVKISIRWVEAPNKKPKGQEASLSYSQPMITRRRTLTLFLAPAAAAMLPVMAQTAQRIPLAQLEEMFENMRAKTKWNVDGPLLWGYFFFDPKEERLQRTAKELDASGYRVVGIQQVSGRQLFRLHVERIEAHTPASLHARNTEFYALAEKQGLASYDGMDVGPAPITAKRP